MSAAIKVAGYCRVSTEQEDQRNSLAAQQRYFKELIEGREDWELYQIYADAAVIIGLKAIRLKKCRKHGTF